MRMLYNEFELKILNSVLYVFDRYFISFEIHRHTLVVPKTWTMSDKSKPPRSVMYPMFWDHICIDSPKVLTILTKTDKICVVKFYTSRFNHIFSLLLYLLIGWFVKFVTPLFSVRNKVNQNLDSKQNILQSRTLHTRHIPVYLFPLITSKFNRFNACGFFFHLSNFNRI